MISETMCSELCAQMNREFSNERIYLAISIDCEQVGWFGASKFFLKQSQEEHGHAMKFLEYIQDQNCRPMISSQEAPPSEWPDFKAVFVASLGREQETSAHIKNLLSLAQNEQDWQTHELLEWFAHEQVEEEKTFQDILRRIALAAGNTAAYFEIDEDLGE